MRWNVHRYHMEVQTARQPRLVSYEIDDTMAMAYM